VASDARQRMPEYQQRRSDGVGVTRLAENGERLSCERQRFGRTPHAAEALGEILRQMRTHERVHFVIE